MKKLIYLNIIGLFLLFGCKPKVGVPVIIENEAKTLKIIVEGTQAGSLEPWKLVVSAESKGRKEEMARVDAMLSDLNSESIKVEWSEKAAGVLKIIQRDGETIDLPFNFLL